MPCPVAFLVLHREELHPVSRPWKVLCLEIKLVEVILLACFINKEAKAFVGPKPFDPASSDRTMLCVLLG
jgi:hypothetical protein